MGRDKVRFKFGQRGNKIMEKSVTKRFVGLVEMVRGNVGDFLKAKYVG